MSGLIRLYPAAWRDRYEEEFLALLQERPPTLGDNFDIVRGAIDARLHPQVRRAEAPERGAGGATGRVMARGLGFGTISGAAIWVACWFIVLNSPVIYDGYGSYRDAGAAYPFILLAIGLLVGGLIGHLIVLPSNARLARVGATLAVAFLLMWSIAPWYPTEYLIASAGLLALAIGAVRAGSWRVVVGAAVVVSLSVITAMSFLFLSGLVGVPEELSIFLMALAGAPIWLSVGGSLVAAPAPAPARLRSA